MLCSNFLQILQKLFFKNNRFNLLSHLKSLPGNSVIIKGKPKSIQKGLNVAQAEFRGSRYRGVSKNKRKWQVIKLNELSLQMTLTLYNKRYYSGGFRTEIEAAREYDRKSISIKGLKVSRY